MISISKVSFDGGSYLKQFLLYFRQFFCQKLSIFRPDQEDCLRRQNVRRCPKVFLKTCNKQRTPYGHLTSMKKQRTAFYSFGHLQTPSYSIGQIPTPSDTLLHLRTYCLWTPSYTLRTPSQKACNKQRTYYGYLRTFC